MDPNLSLPTGMRQGNAEPVPTHGSVNAQDTKMRALAASQFLSLCQDIAPQSRLEVETMIHRHGKSGQLSYTPKTPEERASWKKALSSPEVLQSPPPALSELIRTFKKQGIQFALLETLHRDKKIPDFIHVNLAPPVPIPPPSRKLDEPPSPPPGTYKPLFQSREDDWPSPPSQQPVTPPASPPPPPPPAPPPPTLKPYKPLFQTYQGELLPPPPLKQQTPPPPSPPASPPSS